MGLTMANGRFGAQNDCAPISERIWPNLTDSYVSAETWDWLMHQPRHQSPLRQEVERDEHSEQPTSLLDLIIPSPL